MKLGVWVSNTKSRRDKLTADQLAALAQLGADWALARGVGSGYGAHTFTSSSGALRRAGGWPAEQSWCR